MKEYSKMNMAGSKKNSEPTPYPTYDNHTYKKVNGEIENHKEMTEPVCILGDKVFAFCQQRDCFPRLKVEIGNEGEYIECIGIHFQLGYIMNGTLDITPIGMRRPNFSRVKFTLQIPYTIRLRNKTSGELLKIEGILPDIQKDLIMFMPQSRNEFDYKIVVETRSEVLAPPDIQSGEMELAIGVFSVIRVVGSVQILMPAYTFIPEPPEGENFEELEDDICEKFDKRPFPDDFFPPQFEDLEMGKKQ